MKISLILMSLLAFLAAACSNSTPPTSVQTPPEFEPTASSGLVTDLPAPAPQFSPGQHLRFDRISLEQGLSQSSVFCMLQDSQGFMWFGTEDGLNKYDGYDFTVYKNDPEDPNSLSDNWIQALLEDSSGTLWIGTREGGLVRYDSKSDQFIHYRHDPEDPSSLSDDEITAILQDQDGALWIGTGGGVLDKLVQSEGEGSDQDNERFVHYRYDPNDPYSLSSNAVSAVYEDQEGELWIGTEGGGLNKLVLSEAVGSDSENERWQHYVNDPSDPRSLSHNNITAISEDQSGALWVGTDGGGLDRFDQENERFIHYQHDRDDPESLSSDRITAIFSDQDGVLWLGTWDRGINRFDPETGTFVHYHNVSGDPHSLSSSLIQSIYQDREGILWFGSTGGGVSKLDVGWRNFALYQNDPADSNSLGDNMVRALYKEHNGALWIGTMFAGVDRFDRETGNWRHYRHDPDDPGSLSNDWVSAIHIDRSGVLWIGTRSGLDRLEPGTETFTHYQADPDGPPGSPSNYVTTIYEGQESEFWIGTKSGLYRFDREKKSWSHAYRHDPGDPQSLSHGAVLSILEDRKGRLWIGTWGGGLNRLDPEKETFAHYQNVPGDPHSMCNNLISSIFQDREDALWIGTPGGLDRFDQGTETFTHYREKDGMPNETVYCIVEDGQGRLWLSTNKGLSRFDPQREMFRNYDVTDGLQSNEFNGSACHTSDGEEMFFGGINGFNAFFPDQVKDNPTIPPVALTSLTRGGEVVDCRSTVDCVTEFTFNWPDNAFVFEFAALSFAQPEKNQYAYRLEGFDEAWNEIGTRRYGKYTNLPGGTYTLNLRGSNNDGVWNRADTLAQITIVPPFWATWWFRGILLLVLVGGVIGGYRLRVRNLEARGRELETQVVSRTREQAALSAVASVVSRSLDLERVLTNSLDKTLEVMEMEAGGIYLLRQDDQVLAIAAHKGLGTQFVAEIDNLKIGEGLSGQVVLTGEPLIVQDLSKDPRLTRSAVKDSGFQSLAIAPLVSRAKVLGTLFVVTRRDRDFSQQDIELLISIGGQIGIAVGNAHLYEQAQQVAVVEERSRLARELHDSVTQSLYSLTLFSEAARHIAEEMGEENLEQHIGQIGVIGQHALKEMRLLVYELQPPELEREGLVRALRQRLDAVEGRAGVEARVVVDEFVKLPAGVEQELYRIAQEALNNALKHAAAGSVIVYLRQSNGSIEMEIVDDGVGFKPDALADHGGMGLKSIRERAEQLGGMVTIRSEPGKGTSVKVNVQHERKWRHLND